MIAHLVHVKLINKFIQEGEEGVKETHDLSRLDLLQGGSAGTMMNHRMCANKIFLAICQEIPIFN